MNKRLALFPVSTQIINEKLQIGSCDLSTLAEKYGTPLYLYDRADLDSAASLYRRTLNEYWPGAWTITYAGKAFLCTAIGQWANAQGFCVDCTGAGEIAFAVKAGLPRARIVVHGVNKSAEDLQAALQHAGTIVIDNPSELRRIIALHEKNPDQPLPDLWLRFKPGSSVKTHAYTQTGHSDSKFGMQAEQIMQAAQVCRENELPLKGIHFHQGSQFRETAPLEDGVEKSLDLAAEINFKGEWHLSPGGGWGMAYHEDELPHPSIEEYVRFVTGHIRSRCEKYGLAFPHLHLEPGRSLVAKAGVALYRVGTVKRMAGRTWLLIDGGMADNPRHALYGAKYSCLTVEKPLGSPMENVSIGGPFCESGDVLIEQLPLRAVEEGELLAVPMSGAYHLSMASNYNGARRPAAIMVENGQARLILARETTADLTHRDENL